jgi:hypothetical protein
MSPELASCCSLLPGISSSGDSLEAWHDLLFDTLAISCSSSDSSGDEKWHSGDASDDGPDTPSFEASIRETASLPLPDSTCNSSKETTVIAPLAP